MLNYQTKKNVSYYINFNDLKHFVTCENKSLNEDHHLLHKYYGSSYSRIIKRTYVYLWSTTTNLIISSYKSKILTGWGPAEVINNIFLSHLKWSFICSYWRCVTDLYLWRRLCRRMEMRVCRRANVVLWRSSLCAKMPTKTEMSNNNIPHDRWKNNLLGWDNREFRS